MASFARFGNDLYTGHRSLPIVQRRKLWYIASAVLVAISLIGLFGRGINFGIEFEGGTELRVAGVSDLTDYETRATDTVREAAPEAVEVTVTQVGSETIRIQTGDIDPETLEEARQALSEEFGAPVEDVAASVVGPSWGETVTNKAIQALVVFLVLVTAVLALYFRTWKMAFAAIVALLHDVVFTVGIYALLGIEVSPASMIGFLTILGYSIYDTIVVFDKVRENTEYALDNRQQTYAEAANLAVNQTLVRSINTSVVALLPVAAIMIMGIAAIGPGTLLDLSVALFIGITVGTFSSVFIATPLLVDLRKGEQEIAEHDRRVLKKRPEQPAGAQPEAESEGTEDELVPTGPAAPTAGTEAAPRAAGRQIHPYAQRGPRNQPKRAPRSRR
jgi:preprotein translocase subunit SecF